MVQRRILLIILISSSGWIRKGCWDVLRCCLRKTPSDESSRDLWWLESSKRTLFGPEFKRGHSERRLAKYKASGVQTRCSSGYTLALHKMNPWASFLSCPIKAKRRCCSLLIDHCFQSLSGKIVPVNPMGYNLNRGWKVERGVLPAPALVSNESLQPCGGRQRNSLTS